MRIVVIGLGYVGLPLAVALAHRFETHGLDIDGDRIDELRRGHDRTGEIDRAALEASALSLTGDPSGLPAADAYIVTVPTPIDERNRPDLRPIEAATATVARLIDPARRPVVIYESTVYPGVTEEHCGPRIEALSGLRRGRDFVLGYSPERINPGDREHSVDRIVKVIAGEDDATTDLLDRIYGAVTTAGTFRARSIKVAEAAKVIENAQRDINIAFMNEIAQIFARMDLSTWDVLAAAQTKWNFLPFQPGLVGGHCIGVDPYYLSHRAQALGHQPDIILAGRAMNDGMAPWVADRIDAAAGGRGRVLVLGLTFKEDVPDLRNSKVADLARRLGDHGHRVTVHDPLVSSAEAERETTFALDPDALSQAYDIVVVAVPHRAYRALDATDLARLVRLGGLFADLKGVFARCDLRSDIRRWSL